VRFGIWGGFVLALGRRYCLMCSWTSSFLHSCHIHHGIACVLPHFEMELHQVSRACSFLLLLLLLWQRSLAEGEPDAEATRVNTCHLQLFAIACLGSTIKPPRIINFSIWIPFSFYPNTCRHLELVSSVRGLEFNSFSCCADQTSTAWPGHSKRTH